MKKIFSFAAMLLCGLTVLTSCETDRDSNPTLVQPTSFVVNNPEVGAGVVDLQKSASVKLTWSQPEYTTGNAPVVPTYTVQVSDKNSFNQAYDDAAEDNTGADYFCLEETYSSCTADLNTEDIAKGLMKINGWDETSVPANETLYIRVKAAIKDAGLNELNPIISNTVQMTAAPYYIELKAADPELWWLIGGDICDGSWGSDVGKCVIPMQPIDGYEYDKKTGQGEITWTGYLSGNGFKLRGDMNDGWATQWGQGDAFGSYVKNDGGSGNITVPAAGYYTVTLDTKNDKLSVTAYDGTPTVFASMCVSGDFNDWGDTEMTPCHTASAYNHDWYATVELDGTQGIKFKEAGSWDYNTGGAANTTSAGDLYGYGSNNGDNIYPAAGTYLVIYNDITRYYRFILQ